MRIIEHKKYRNRPEKGFKFRLFIRAVDQDNIGVGAKISIDAADDHYEEIGSYVEYNSIFEFEWNEITITAEYAGQKQIVHPNDKNVVIHFNIPKAPPPPIIDEANHYVPPPPEPSHSKKKRKFVQEEEKEVIEKQDVYEEEDGETLHDLQEEQNVEIDPDEKLQMNLKEFMAKRPFEILPDFYSAMDYHDIPAIVQKIHTISQILNKEMQKKMKGNPTIKISTERKGPLAIGSTVKTIARQVPEMHYYDLISKTPPKNCNILIDISSSTNTIVTDNDNRGLGIGVRIKNALLMAALSIAEVILELGGNVNLILFSDKDHPSHGKKIAYSKNNQRSVIEELLELPAAGGTRLDDVLDKIMNIYSSKEIDNTFILLDGAPVEGEGHLDADDFVQQEVLKKLATIEEKSHLFILWASSPDNDEEMDQFFFKRCELELLKTQVVNVQSFPAFIKYAQKIWQMPPVTKKPPTIYNTNLIWPFEIDEKTKKIIKSLEVPENVDETVHKIRKWVVDNFKYTFPFGREYRTAQEVIDTGNGCCGEFSNLLVGCLRFLGIKAGILDVKYIEQARIHHACVGYLDNDKPMCLDVTMGEINSTKALTTPLSDARWQRLMEYWRGNKKSLDNRE